MKELTPEILTARLVEFHIVAIDMSHTLLYADQGVSFIRVFLVQEEKEINLPHQPLRNALPCDQYCPKQNSGKQ